METKEDKYLIDIINAEYERIKSSLIDISKSFSDLLEVDENSYENQTLINGLYNQELSIKDELLHIIKLVDTKNLVYLLDMYKFRYKYNVIKYSLYALKDFDRYKKQTEHKKIKVVKNSFTTNVDNMRDNGYIFTIKEPKGIDEIESELTTKIKDEFSNHEHLKAFITYLLSKSRFNAKDKLITKPLKQTSKMSIDELENLKAQLQNFTINLSNILK